MAQDQSDNMHLFLDISVYLTGFSKIELQGTGMLEIYFNTINANTNPDVVRGFYDEVSKILALDNEKAILKRIEAELMPLSKFQGLGQLTILMWYMGTWATWTDDTSKTEEDENKYSLQNSVVISANSYVQGLVWDAAETHPPGAKQPGFDSWAHPPIEIKC